MRLLLFILAVVATSTSFGQNRADSINVYFNVGHRYFDPTLSNNREVMGSFIDYVKEAAAAGNVDSIVVYGYASPDGKPRANERLARNRCAAIAEYIATKSGVDPSLIEQRPAGISWNELRRLVDAEQSVPRRQEVLSILDNTPVWVYDGQGRLVDSRKRQLMNLAGGRSWNWMYQHLFPQLRNAVAISLYRHPAELTEEADPAPAAEELPAPEAETTGIAEPVIAPAADDHNDASATEATGATATTPADGYKPLHRFALKTNMLYYAALMPNLEFEWLINERWSVAVEGNLAWWGSYKKEKSYRMAIIDAEARHWIKPREPWHGMYVGLIAGGGWYDLEKGTPGHYGEGLMTGLSFGYMWPIARNLSLEAEVGAGYVFTRYKDYQPYQGHHVYMRTKDINYFGPIKLKFSIVWRFFDINKPKLTEPAL